MKIRILDGSGREVTATTQHGAPPLHLIELQMQAPKVLPGVNIGMRAIERIGRKQAAYAAEFNAWQKRVDAGEDDPGEEPEEPDTTVLSIGIITFLSLRAAGDRVTFEQALTTPVRFVPDADDDAEAAAVEAADPPMPGSDDPATAETDVAPIDSTGPSTT